MKYTVELSDECVIEVDVAPGAPALRDVKMEFAVRGRDLDDTLERMGGRGWFHLVRAGVWASWHRPLRRDGEQVGHALFEVWVRDDPPEPRQVAAEEAARLGVAPGGGRW